MKKQTNGDDAGKAALYGLSRGNACPVTHTLKAIGGKWKPLLIFCVTNGITRFGALQRAIPDISKQMLTQQLRELEADGIFSRTIFPEVPPRVEYALTERGYSLLPVIHAMRQWGEADLAQSPAPAGKGTS